MSVVIPDGTLQAARMSGSELKQEIAMLLFQQHKLTLGQASRLAEISQWRFQHLLASRHRAVHHDVADFEADLITLRDLGRL
jgi:predicted HTH domain antitoxin